MKLRAITLAMGTLALGLSAPVHAWDELSTDENCRIGITYELGTTIAISKSKTKNGDPFSGGVMGEDVSIFLQNDDWQSLSADSENLVADFVLRFEDSQGNWFENYPIISDQSLFLRVKMEWLTNLENSRSVVITRDGKKVGVFDWTGFWYPWTKFQRCVREARAPIIEQERQDRIRRETPKDPFAPS